MKTKTESQDDKLTTQRDPSSAPPEIRPAINFEQDAGKGLEGADRKSYAIPFVGVLQALSPQVAQGTVADAKAGMFYNTITGQLMKEILVIPCAFQRRFVRWGRREDGGGYKGDYLPTDIELGKVEGAALAEDGFTWEIDGDYLKDARNHFVLVRDAGEPMGVWSAAVLSLTSTQIKKSKRWLSRISGLEMKNNQGRYFNPPSFSHVYRVKSVREQNQQGTWFGVEIELVGPVEDADLYARAKHLNEAVSKGEVQVAEPPRDDTAPPAADADRF